MEELENISPELSKIKKENPFKVPNNYFDDFSARMQIKLAAEKEPAAKQIRFMDYLKPAIGIAASFALIMLLVYVPLKTFIPNKTNTTASAEFSDTEFLNMIEDIDENSFFALLEETEESETFTDDELTAYISANFSEYEIYVNTEME
jgi:hypothetical protein